MRRFLGDIMVKNIFFSIIVPIFRTDINKLKKCLDSLVSQTYKDIEILLIFDGPNAEQFEYCSSNYSESNINLIEMPKSGVSKARNLGINMARGEYVMFCDSDDWFENEICEKAYDAIISGGYDMLFWDYICDLEKCIKINRLYPSSREFVGESKKKCYFGNICRVLDTNLNKNLMFGTGGIWNKAYKRELLIQGEIQFPENCTISEDIIFNLYTVRHSVKIGYIQEIGYHYRIANNSTSFRFDSNVFDKNNIYFDCLEKFIDEIEEIELKKDFEKIKYNVIVNSFVRCVEQLRLASMSDTKLRHKCNALCKEKYHSNFYKTAIINSNFSYATFPQKICLFLLKLRQYNMFLLIVDLKNKQRNRE